MWFIRDLIAMVYKQSQEDYTLSIKHSCSGEVLMLLVYVDDITVTRNDVAHSK